MLFLLSVMLSPCPAAQDRSIDSLLSQAHDAQRKGYLERADDLYRSALDQYPENKEAYRGLLALQTRRTLPVDSPAYTSASKHLPRRFWTHETQRFIILSEAEQSWTRMQAENLEKVYHQFNRFARRMNLKPRPLKHKLVCVLFNDRDSYLKFAREQDNVTAGWIAGYYAPQADRIVFYDVEASEGIAQARAQLFEMKQEIHLIEQNASRAQRQGHQHQAAQLRANAHDYQKHLKKEQQRVNSFADSLSVATTVHEAIHQLLFHTRIQSPRVAYPLWISEGLATAFETSEVDQYFGPDREYEQRRQEFFHLLEADELISLPKLVMMTEAPENDEKLVRQLYHQSYAFVTWISRFRSSALRDYLARMATQTGELKQQTHLFLFEQAFGDVRKLQRDWLKHEHMKLNEQKAKFPTRPRMSRKSR